MRAPHSPMERPLTSFPAVRCSGGKPVDVAADGTAQDRIPNYLRVPSSYPWTLVWYLRTGVRPLELGKCQWNHQRETDDLPNQAAMPRWKCCLRQPGNSVNLAGKTIGHATLLSCPSASPAPDLCLFLSRTPRLDTRCVEMQYPTQLCVRVFRLCLTRAG